MFFIYGIVVADNFDSEDLNDESFNRFYEDKDVCFIFFFDELVFAVRYLFFIDSHSFLSDGDYVSVVSDSVDYNG